MLISTLFVHTGCSDGDIRLTNGTNSSEGRVEICFNNEWGTVCGQMWNNTDAAVVCRQLKFASNGISIQFNQCKILFTIINYFIGSEPLSGAFGEGTGRIWLDNVQCSGSERQLRDCMADSSGINSCTHAQDAGVRCPPGIDCGCGYYSS